MELATLLKKRSALRQDTQILTEQLQVALGDIDALSAQIDAASVPISDSTLYDIDVGAIIQIQPGNIAYRVSITPEQLRKLVADIDAISEPLPGVTEPFSAEEEVDERMCVTDAAGQRLSLSQLSVDLRDVGPRLNLVNYYYRLSDSHTRRTRRSGGLDEILEILRGHAEVDHPYKFILEVVVRGVGHHQNKAAYSRRFTIGGGQHD
jgi:hypothetical protein